MCWQVPAAVEAVKERLTYYQKKRDEKKANPEEVPSWHAYICLLPNLCCAAVQPFEAVHC
jgi:hypothetical protein